MVELGQLEARHETLTARGVRLLAASLDGREDTALTQEKFPHLTILSDAEQSLARAADVIGPHRSPTDGDTVSPTTVLIDRTGQVRWVFRADRFLTRLTPEELLTAVNTHLPKGQQVR